MTSVDLKIGSEKVRVRSSGANIDREADRKTETNRNPVWAEGTDREIVEEWTNAGMRQYWMLGGLKHSWHEEMALHNFADRPLEKCEWAKNSIMWKRDWKFWFFFSDTENIYYWLEHHGIEMFEILQPNQNCIICDDRPIEKVR